MNNLLLKLVFLFRPLFEKLGVQTHKMKVILDAKLKMDSRRTSMLTRGFNNSKKNSYVNIITTVYYFIMGLFLMVVCFIVIEDTTSAIAIYQTIWIILLSLTLISDFTDVLIDVRDNYILLPRPVNDRTLTVSRIVHIFLYLLRLFVPFIVPGLIFMIIDQGILGTSLFLIQNLLSVVFSIFLVNILYLSILKYANQQKFKEIINYFQISFIIITMTIYYLLPNLIDFTNLEGFNIMDNTWSYFLPGTWIANLWALLIEGNFAMPNMIMAGLGIFVPFASLYIIIKGLSKDFSQKLIGIGQGSTEVVREKKTEKNSLKNWWRKRITKVGEERAGFDLAWLMTARSRDYKLRTYAMFGFIPVLFVYFIALYGEGTFAERWEALQASHQYLFLIYICIYSAFVPIMNLQYSEKFKAAWLFQALPLAQPGKLIKGSVKAMIARFVIPIFIISTVFVITIWGMETLDDIIIGFINILFICALAGKMLLKEMPFSQSWTTQNKGDTVVWSFAIMFILGAVGFMHWLIVDYFLIVLLWGILFSFLTWWIFKEYK